MNFPHLADTTFPNVSNVNVYQFQNKFDYTRWNSKTTITLCNVPWNSDYTDVVKFDTNADRDSWFDGLGETWVKVLETEARVVPENYIKLPIPYDVMAQYNYLFIDMPVATSPEHMIDFEDNGGIRRWYFFVNSITYLAPNATQVYVLPDVWTNFQNDIDITYMLLERGHAPVSVSDTDTYLANPIAANRYLLAPDVNFDNAGITRSSSFVPFGNGNKYVCIASTCGPEQTILLGTVAENPAYNPTGTITYSDVNARYGYQLQVNGFTVGNGRDYSDANTPARVGYSEGLIPNNLTVYAIAAESVYGNNATFYRDVLYKCPQFLTTVKGCFVVDENCLTLSNETWSIAGHTVHTCVGKGSNLLTLALSKADFNYPSELQRFAKLYTSPYAKLEITDNNGSTFDVNIEETSTLSVKSVVALAFPYINERVYVDGIGGTGSKTYTWKDLRGGSEARAMPNSDWFKYCFDWEIPTFALYMNGATAFQLETFNRNVKQAIQQSLVNYHNTIRSANTAYENACDQADVAYTNTEAAALTARTNAYNSADTGKVNADNSADTMKANADYLADVAYNNLDRSCTAATWNVNRSNTGTAYNEETGITYSTAIKNGHNIQNTLSRAMSNALIQSTTDTNIQSSTSAATASGSGTITSAMISGATTGAMFGAGTGGVAVPGIGTIPGALVGAGVGAIVGAVGGSVSASTAKTVVGITTNSDAVICAAQIDANRDIQMGDNATATLDQDYQNAARRDVYANNAAVAVAIQDNSNTTSRANGADNQTAAKAVALNNQTTQKTNATNTKNTSRTNASNTYEVTEDNADRTKSNVKVNSLYTRQVAVLNAKEILENGKYAAMAAILDSRNSAPIECCEYSGDPTQDYMRIRGIQIKVKTQSDSAIRQTGAIFARYGYTLNQVWDVATSGLKLMRHFTYWKASEIWVVSKASSNNSVNTFIRNMFLKGVTVWDTPEEIGAVSVYDN